MTEFSSIAKVEEATFIKPKNKNTTAVLLHFKTPVPPQNLDIPGERFTTNFYHFKNKVMICKKGLDLGQTMKNCKKSQKCKVCCSEDHQYEDCL